MIRGSTVRWARTGLTIVLVVLCFVMLVETLAIARNGLDPAFLGRWLPTFFYLYALWAARRAIMRIEQGQGLRSLLSQLLTRVGVALFAGGIVRVFVVPIGLLIGTGQGAVAHYDVAAIALGAVGVSLVAIAKAVAQAERAQATLDEFI